MSVYDESMLLSTITNPIISVVLVVIVCFVWYTRKPSYNLPPLPHSWPMVGNLFSLPRDQPIYKWFYEVAKTYGPVFRISIGLTEEAIVLNNYAVVHEAMIDKQLDFAGRVRSEVFDIYSEGYMNVAFAEPTDQSWHIRRKHLVLTLRAFSVGEAFENRIRENYQRMATELDKLANRVDPFNPTNYCKLFSYNYMADSCFGQSYELNDPELLEIEEIFEEFLTALTTATPIDFLPILAYLPFKLPQTKKMEKRTKIIMDLMEKKIEQHRLTYDPDNISDLTYHVLKQMKDWKDASGKSELSPIHLRGLIVDMFTAGVDTMHSTLRWLLLCLAMYPDIQEKLYDEIVREIGQGSDEGDTTPHLKHRPNMPFSYAVLLECIRFGTVVPQGLPHRTLCDTTVGGYDIPAATMVIVNQWAINNDETEHKDPDKFVPERFFAEDKSLEPRLKSYVSFGLGRRACPGESVGKSILWLFMIMFCQRYKILPPPNTQLKAEYENDALVGVPLAYEIVLQRR